MATADVLGTNLTPSHPVAMKPVDDGHLLYRYSRVRRQAKIPQSIWSPEKWNALRPDPHVQNNDPVVKMFLVRSNVGGAMCLACHDVQPNTLNGWTTGPHATATNSVPTIASFGPYGAVASDACQLPSGA